jgi:preprotein translocase subunit SecD
MSSPRALSKTLAISLVASSAILIVLVLAWMRPWLAHLITPHPNVFLTYEVDVAHACDSSLTADDVVKRTANVMEKRLEGMKVPATLTPRGSQIELIMALSDKSMREPVERMLARSGRLEFRLVDDASDFMSRLSASALLAPTAGVSVGHDSWQERDSGRVHTTVRLTANDRHQLEIAIVELLKTTPLPADHEILLEETWHPSRQWRSYYVFRRADVSGDFIEDATASWDTATGRPEIQLTFDADGAKRFAQITADAVGRKLAIVVEGQVATAPVIEGKIAGGRARITVGGAGDAQHLREDARALVEVLRTGSLAAPVRLVSASNRIEIHR